MICKNFLPLWEVPSHFLDDIVHSTKVLNLMNSYLSNFSFLFRLCLWCRSKKSLPNLFLFCPKSFVGLVLMFRLSTISKLSFVSGVR